MRGKAYEEARSFFKHGITPAYAGKRTRTPVNPMCRRDHPRVCGEKTAPGTSWCKSWGSPPRMRGKVLSGTWKAAGAGITPAYAGKSPSAPSSKSLCRDHPRVCGEKFERSSKVAVIRGSPPRMRGKGSIKTSVRPCSRITPAYAGKSLSIKTRKMLRLGSPPRMRGKASPLMPNRQPAGITPAYAGKRGNHGRDHEPN